VEWRAGDGGPELAIRPAGKGVRLYVVQTQDGGRWATRVGPAGEGVRAGTPVPGGTHVVRRLIFALPLLTFIPLTASAPCTSLMWVSSFIGSV